MKSILSFLRSVNWIFWVFLAFICLVIITSLGRDVDEKRVQENAADMCMHRGVKSAKATKYIDGILFEAVCLNGDRVTRGADE